MTRPDGVLALHDIARRGAQSVQARLVKHVVMGGDLHHRVG